jgi:cob(I)alamin adenosyltransferase
VIYTKKGDEGQTVTLLGEKVSKNDLIIHFEGEADELNARLGMVKAMLMNDDAFIAHCRQFLEDIQKNIMKLMSLASDPSNHDYHFHGEEASVLEKEIDSLSENLPERHEFVLPGKNMIEAQIHLARTAARKTERLFFAVNEKKKLCPQASAYLNRLSDYLFVLARIF